MTVWTPIERSSVSNSFESGLGGSLRPIRPMIFTCWGAPLATARTRYPCWVSVSNSIGAIGPEGAICATTAGAPFMMRCSFPDASTISASAILVAGSKGVNSLTFTPGVGYPFPAVRMAASTGSWPASELAKAARARTSPSTRLSFIGLTAVTRNSLCVSVPVLSAHSTSSVAASWIAERRVRSTPFLVRT